MVRFGDAVIRRVRCRPVSDVVALGPRSAVLVGDLGGRVIDVGAGTGANLPFFRSADEVLAVEPDPAMRRRPAGRASRCPAPMTLCAAGADDPRSGTAPVLEHVVGDGRPAAWRHRLDPLWTRMAAGCHLDRDTESAIRAAGFEPAGSSIRPDALVGSHRIDGAAGGSPLTERRVDQALPSLSPGPDLPTFGLVGTDERCHSGLVDKTSFEVARITAGNLRIPRDQFVMVWREADRRQAESARSETDDPGWCEGVRATFSWAWSGQGPTPIGIPTI